MPAPKWDLEEGEPVALGGPGRDTGADDADGRSGGRMMTTGADEDAIQGVASDYIEGWFDGDAGTHGNGRCTRNS